MTFATSLWALRTPAAWWTLEAFVVAMGCLVLAQVWVHLRAFNDPEFEMARYASTALVSRFVHEDGRFQLERERECGYATYQWLHFGPALVWALILPLQISSWVRKQAPGLHRFLGEVFFACSLALAASSLVFVVCGTTYSKLEDIPVMIASPWFAWTGVRAWRLAGEGDFAQHWRWVVRHVSAGLGVYAMRFFYIVAFLTYEKVSTSPLDDGSATATARKWLFGSAALAAFVVCPTTAELVLAAYSRSKAD